MFEILDKLAEYSLRWRPQKPYEPEVCARLAALVKPGWVCADVGAHRGYYTRFLASLVGPHGRIVSFEASPANTRKLRQKVLGWGFRRRVRVENLAVSDGAVPRLNIYAGRRSSNAEWNIMGRDVAGNPTEIAFTVPATSLDAYFKTDSRLDLVKMDIEGAEGLALTGMRHLLRQTQPVLVIEFHNPEAWAGRRELHNAGYTLFTTRCRVGVEF